MVLQPLLVVPDEAGARAAASLLDAVASDGLGPATLCLPVEALAGGDAALEQDVADLLRPALVRRGTAARLVVRAHRPRALVGRIRYRPAELRARMTRARSILGDRRPRRPRSASISPSFRSTRPQAAAQTALVGQIAQEIAPEAGLRVVLGGFVGVDAGRLRSRAYLTALDRWHASARTSLAGPGRA